MVWGDLGPEAVAPLCVCVAWNVGCGARDAGWEVVNQVGPEAVWDVASGMWHVGSGLSGLAVVGDGMQMVSAGAKWQGGTQSVGSRNSHTQPGLRWRLPPPRPHQMAVLSRRQTQQAMGTRVVAVAALREAEGISWHLWHRQANVRDTHFVQRGFPLP